MSSSDLDIRPRAGALGASIHGLSLRAADEAQIAAVSAALDEYLVLFFPDQHLTPKEHRDFGLRFGELEEGHEQLADVADDAPGVVVLDSATDVAADVWHTDVTYRESPPIASILNMVECAPVGGDTMWINLQRVFDALSDPMQELLEGLTALHSAKFPGASMRPAEHPVVRVHPNSGRKSLYVNRIFTDRIVQLSPTESKALLAYLYRFAEQPRFSVRYAWSTGDVGMWDNRATLHAAVSDYVGERRIIQRCTVIGDEPRGASEPRWKKFDKRNQAASDFYDLAYDF